jgi:hypothetical protein
MEVSLLAALMGIYSASFKVSRIIRQEHFDNFHVFRGGDHDLILIPVDSSHALLLAGKGLADSDRILKTVEGMLFVRGDVENILRTLGVTSDDDGTESDVTDDEAGEDAAPVDEMENLEPEPEVDVDELFAVAGKQKGVADLDAFWDDAVEKTGNIPLNADVITFDDAQKLGLQPGKAAIKGTGSLRSTGQLKKK